MKLQVVLGLTSLVAAEADAQSLAQTFTARTIHGRALNLRLTQDQPFAVSPLYHSVVSMETGVGPQKSVAFNLIRTVPKRPGSADFRYDGKVKRARAAAVSFRLKF